MNSFALLPGAARAEVFEETAAKRKIGRPMIVEKDFWVSWALAQLYGPGGPSEVKPDSEPTLLFKGGTSLSKVYGLIDRFSEDVDLTVDRTLLVPASHDPEEKGIPKREQKRRIEKIVDECTAYVRGTIAPFLQSRTEAGRVVMDATDPLTLRYHYPQALDSREYGEGAYVATEIRLEFGARGELWPAELGKVSPYAALEFPALFSEPSTPVWALAPQRTFWEKATILHAIAESGRLPAAERQSRHYSDLARMTTTQEGQAALKDVGLLRAVADHKATYFAFSAARYELARPGSLRLVPDDDLVRQLRLDYNSMSEMFVTEPPGFDEVISKIAALEATINAHTI